MKRSTRKKILTLLVLALSLSLASNAFAQKDKKKKQADDAAAQTATTNLMQNQPEQDKIDFAISEMLGACRLATSKNCTKILPTTLLW